MNTHLSQLMAAVRKLRDARGKSSFDLAYERLVDTLIEIEQGADPEPQKTPAVVVKCPTRDGWYRPDQIDPLI